MGDDLFTTKSTTEIEAIMYFKEIARTRKCEFKGVFTLDKIFKKEHDMTGWQVNRLKK